MIGRQQSSLRLEISMDVLTFSVIFLLITLHFYEYAANFIQFVPLSDLDGFMCSMSEMVFNVSIVSGGAIACMLKCGNHTTCQSTFYHNGTGQCVGCMNMYSASVDETDGFVESYAGTLHFMKQVCPIGWRGWRQACYKKTSTSGSFQAGVDECALDQGHAVHVENIRENSFLRSVFNGHFGSYMYIGVIFQSSKWVYHSTGEEATLKYYASGHGKTYPTGKDCSGFASWHSSVWYNTDCSNNYPTLCEINL